MLAAAAVEAVLNMSFVALAVAKTFKRKRVNIANSEKYAA